MQLLAVRLTVLRAPCGFGKTALLIEACHAARDGGAAVFWLACGKDPEGETFSRDLAALRRNLALRTPPDSDPPPRATTGEPVVLALDDVELLRPPDAAAVDSLLRHGPPNLHIAMAMRTNPHGLDTATPIINGQGRLFGAEDLRFLDAEIARYLGRDVPRRDLTSISRTTQGWPAAVGIVRSLRRGAGLDEASLSRYGTTLGEHLAIRLVRGLSKPSREYLASLALVDRIDLGVLAAAFPDEHARCWEDVSTVLGTLIRPLDSDGGVRTLHPVARRILRTRSPDDADRDRRTHRRLAEAIADRNGPTVDAVAHAVRAGDYALCERILEDGLMVLLAGGVTPFLDICRHLTAEAVERAPGLASLRIVAFLLQGRLAESRSLLESYRRWAKATMAGQRTAENRTLRTELDIVEALWTAFSCPLVDYDHLAPCVTSVMRRGDDDRAPSANRGVMHAILMVKDCQWGRFELSRRRGAMARGFYRLAGADFGVATVDLNEGIAAMAQGRPTEAAKAFARSGLGEMADTLALELDIERNRGEHIGADRRAPREASRWVAGWFDIQAGDHGNRAEMAFETGGPGTAVETVAASLDWAERQDLPRLKRLLAAQRAFWLVRADDPEAARRTWLDAALPESTAGVLDLTRQSWREFEAVACARIAWLGAVGEIDAARRLAASVRVSAHGWGLKRLLMRCLAVWSALEQRASNPDAAQAYLRDFLVLYRDADYSRPLAREGGAVVEILEDMLAGEPEGDIRTAAEKLFAELGGPPSGEPDERLSAREIEILEGLARGLRNKEIARALGLTDSGVRYHLKALYRTLGTSSRIDAVRRAGELGIALDP
ncbi:MAG: LuxR C-terminal-related transcriptional regulator [Acidobacteria bacterium]|nr:LuxR C-terminal-related transcriptional regulator [Acidobacteriota bacterium]